MISFRCVGCGRIINAGDDKAGMAAVCRWCGADVVVPAAGEFIEGTDVFAGGPDIERALQRSGGQVVGDGDEGRDRSFCSDGFEGALAGGPITDDAMTGLSAEQANVYLPDDPFGVRSVEQEEPAKRSLPWPFDAILYPVSKGGGIMLGVLVGLPIACQWFMRLIGMWQYFLLIPYLLVLLLIVFYWFWYAAYCIRDSAAGGIRAPDIVGAAPDFLEIIWQWLQMVIAVTVCFVPLFIYLTSRAKAVREGAVAVEDVGLGTTFWVLVAVGVFLSPMTLLSVVMSESLGGLHPLRLAMSILKVLPVYCALICAYVMIVYAVIWVMWNWGIPLLASNVIYAGSVYLSLVSCHVLGWFYHRYRETLGWEG